MARLVGAWPTSGYRRMTALLRGEGVHVNHKHGVRFLGERGRQGRRPRPRPRTTPSDHPSPCPPNLVQGLTIGRPDQG